MGERANKQTGEGGEESGCARGLIGDEMKGGRLQHFTQPFQGVGGDGDTLVVQEEPGALQKKSGIVRTESKKVGIRVGEKNIIDKLKESGKKEAEGGKEGLHEGVGKDGGPAPPEGQPPGAHNSLWGLEGKGSANQGRKGDRPEAICDVQFSEERRRPGPRGEERLELREVEGGGLAKVGGKEGIEKTEVTDEASFRGGLVCEERRGAIRMRGRLEKCGSDELCKERGLAGGGRTGGYRRMWGNAKWQPERIPQIKREHRASDRT